ncbi:MAG: MMPL family transporter [Spirochaetales bacterium]|nr:MMPL family transporter [Spirochaetales bacterium]
MGKLIVKYRIIIIILFILLSIWSVKQWSKVTVVKELASFLPDDIDSIKAQKILSESFGSSASAILFFKNINDKETYFKVIKYIRNHPQIKTALGPDQVGIFTVPEGFLPDVAKELFYQGKGIFVTVEFLKQDNDPETLNAIGDIINYTKNFKDVIFTGSSVMNWEFRRSFRSSAFPWYFLVSIGIMIIMLILTTKTVIPPFLFILNLAFAYIINMGTNGFLSSISYLTNAITAALQFGVSMDYSLFLFHRYFEEKKINPDKKTAMAISIDRTFVSILGSSLTTFIGFLAITIMTLKLGFDLGIVVAKGVLLSLVCSVTLLPSLILIFDKIIEKTSFESFSFSKISLFSFLKTRKIKKIITKANQIKKINLRKKYGFRTLIIIIGIIICILIPFIFYQGFHLPISYRLDDSMPKNLKSFETLNDIMKIAKTGDILNIVLPVPSFYNFNRFKLQKAISEIKKIDGVSLVFSINDYAHPSVPLSFIPYDQIETFYKKGYMKIYLKILYPPGTKESVVLLEKIKKVFKKYYGEFYISGQSELLYDFIKIAKIDFARINLASLIFIFIILLFLFTSPVFSIILLIVVEFAVMLNLYLYSIFAHEISFIANMIIGSIQLGSTIDYALLYITRFLEEYKKDKDLISAIKRTSSSTASTIFSASLCLFLATVGFNLFDPVNVVSNISGLIGRGAIVSFLVVELFMPFIVLVFSKLIINMDNRKRRIYSIFSRNKAS